jgi:hypothetical protein
MTKLEHEALALCQLYVGVTRDTDEAEWLSLTSYERTDWLRVARYVRNRERRAARRASARATARAYFGYGAV